ncbi:glucose-6-phosphate isomerase [Proteiniborus sp. MB09-C3]|uniref:glucose-6-phosphate isomerase n=1 Tax=Proteiniborus sp. MB09-C3 TaxID=3050072 RepID=UPI002555C2BB|nr:glucose-6-phosphate isomerase [Proteiniborus sp. MB09-C3]WIV13028.1 glucose-6-phosphate isomerase [Proteiniborus sp. MB09-C3]
MQNIFLDFSNSMVLESEIENIKEEVFTAHEVLQSRAGLGKEYLGWMDYPINYDRKEFERIKRAAAKIKNDSQALIVIGIGGSYLGAKATIEALSHSFYNLLPVDERKTPEIHFVGNNISTKYLVDLLDIVKGKDISINVISKSGTTTEPAIAFRIFKEYIEKKYGREEASKRIYVTTDKEKGALKKLAEDEKYETFVVPDDIGGRFSVLTPVGLLPIAAAGIDIELLMEGARSAREEYCLKDLEENHCYMYAAIRNILYRKGKNVEILASYEPSMHYTAEWWKQLYGESEGKNGKGIFPTSADFSTDLHSLGQYIQDGRRFLFETTINIGSMTEKIKINSVESDIDGLNYLAGKTVDYVNKMAFKGTVIAHVDGGVPNIIISIPKIDEFYYGKLIYFFEKACAISGYLLEVNPFDQPGVEAYKKNMFALLGKPGYENLKKELEKRI